jgi:filamentous hemagglutinin
VGNAHLIINLLGGNINQYRLIAGEGTVGTYGDLLKCGRRCDNLTPHDVPSNAYMKAKIQEYTINQGIAIMMEHLSPGKGGRHRQTLSYGKSPDLTLSPRQILAQEIWNVRSIYVCQRLYSSEIRKSLQTLIKLNKEAWLNVFDKGGLT